MTITGSGFTGATAVAFGSVAATKFTVVSSTQISVVSPAQPAGLHNVYVTGPAGTSAAVIGDLFTYVSPPAVTSVSPNSGPAAGGTSVTITGSGFTGATAVAFGSVAATKFTVVSSTQISVVSPAQPAGLHNVYVTGPAGTSAAVIGDLFTYVSPPAVTSVSPNSGPAAGGTSVTITGSGFTGATAVAFGERRGHEVHRGLEHTDQRGLPAQPAGLHNVYVTGPAGTSAAVFGDLFTYQ